MTEKANITLDNVLAYYQFDSGALTTDSSGNSRTLTNNNTVGETASGKYGYAADFGDPNADKNFTRNEAIWNNVTPFSFAAWVKVSDLTSDNGFFYCTKDTVNKQLLFWWDQSAGDLRGGIFRVGVGYDWVDGAITLTSDWHHVALTLTTGAGGTLKTYFDGSEVNSDSVTNASGTTNQGNKYAVGGGQGTLTTLKGYMDDVVFTSDVLTPTEISDLASNPLGGIYTII